MFSCSFYPFSLLFLFSLFPLIFSENLYLYLLNRRQSRWLRFHRYWWSIYLAWRYTSAHQTLSVGHLRWGQWGIQGNLCVKAESRGTQPELHLGTVALHQDPHNFILPGSLGGQNTANGSKGFLPHSDQEGTDRLGKNKSSQSLAMHTWAHQSLDVEWAAFSSPTPTPGSPLPLWHLLFSHFFSSLSASQVPAFFKCCVLLPLLQICSQRTHPLLWLPLHAVVPQTWTSPEL